MPFNRPAILIVLLLAVGIALIGRSLERERPQVQRSRILLGTVVEITALGDDREHLEEAVTDAFAEMDRIEKLMSPHVATSDVARLSGADQSLNVAAETAAVLRLGLEVARRSGGAFDLTLGRLKKVWGVESDRPQVPTEDEIEAALTGIGFTSLQVENSTVTKAHPTLAVDLGGVAKGYAIDRAVAVLAEAGVAHASVNAGGDMRLLGDRGERLWRIGIRHPRDASKLLDTFLIRDKAVVTSGDYERYFEQEGQRYHHLFDPRTGWPATAARSVTVLADSAMLADALATAVFILGPEQGLALLAEYPKTEGLIVDDEGTLYESAGIAEYRP